MKINFRNGKFNNITGGTNADPFANSMAAIDALASRPPIPDNFTGYVDTENGYAFNTVDLESQHKTATEELMRASAPGLHRYSPHYGPNGPFMSADTSGGYVLYADYVKLEQGYMHEVNAHAETKVEHNRLAHELQHWQEKAEALHNERRKFRGGLVKALGVATGWGHDYPSDDQLVDRVSEMVIRGDNRAKDNKKLTDDYRELHNSNVLFRGDVATSLGLTGTITLGMVLEAISELKTRLHFADDFKVQVYNLVELPTTAVHDRVFYRIQDLKKAEHELKELKPAHQQLIADHITFKGKVAMAVGYDMVAPMPSMEMLAAQVKVMAETAKLVEVPDAFTTAGVEVSSSVGSDRAVFECTFGWARDNWDLFVDKFVWNTISNPTSIENGYIKVVTTGN